MSLPILVKMKARAWTDGNPDEVRDRVFQAPMDPDLIQLAGSQEEAVAEFCKHAPYIGEVLSVDWFEIGKSRYTWNYEILGWKIFGV